MATYNIGNTGVNTKGGLQWQGTPKVTVVEIIVDLSKRTGLNVPAAGYAAADILQLCDIKKGTYILYGTYEVLVAEVASSQFGLGDNAAAGTFCAVTTSMAATGNPTVFPTATTKLYTADDVLKFTINAMASGSGQGKIAFHVAMLDMATN